MPLARRPGTPASAVLGFVVAAVMGLLVLWTQDEAVELPGAGAPSTASSPTHDFTVTTTPTVDPTGRAGTGASTDPESGLPLVRLADLPPGASEAVERIDRGGPFPFPDDDAGVFENREELLPDRPVGHYREYTVRGRPGDRGPLRIVAGEDGELYWTEDHYRSFSRIER